jgi:tetratricopeptide (TPR) repeat protein
MNAPLFDQAQQAFQTAEKDPGLARTLAEEILARARRTGDVATCSVAERALAAAALHVSNLGVAMTHARSAVRYGQRADSSELVAQARMTFAFAASSRGWFARALREADAALPGLRGVDRVRGLAQRGVILHQHGRLDDAIASYNAALPQLRRAGDEMWVWRVLSNRGVLHGHRFALSQALADLLEASRVADALDMGLSAAFTLENLGWIHMLRGDLPRALFYLDEAEGRLRSRRAQLGEVLRDRSELLLSMNLVAEARTAAAAAVVELERDRRLVVVPEVRLLLARAALLDGDPDAALGQARLAAREFIRAKRHEWVPLARFGVVTARLAGPDRAQVRVGEVQRAADQLEATPWAAATLDARIAVGQVALARGRTSTAVQYLQRATQSTARGPAALRARSWYATALLRHATGNNRGTLRALRAGLRVIDEHRTTLGATDLRARAAAHRTDLIELGLRTAIDGRRNAPENAFEWAERGRASLLLIQPVRPPDDPVLATALAELRAAVTEVGDLRRAGHNPVRPLNRQIALETRIRNHCRQQPGMASLTDPVSLDALRAALGSATLVEFVELDQQLHAIVVVEGTIRMHRLVKSAETHDLLDRLAFALHRLAGPRRGPSSAAGRSAAMLVLRHAAEHLDRLLLRPVGRPDGPLVVVPTGRLQSLPWSVLPSCQGRPVTVAPSATTWHRAQRPADAPTGSVAVIAGPDLPGGQVEAETVGDIYEADILDGPSATVAATTAALTRADLAHLAVHGSLSHDNPLFSSLRLSDGPLMVYDLERLSRVPPTVVLAACDSGRHVVCAGDELLGLSTAFLAKGTRQIVASVIPIPDAETVPLMVAFHRRIVAGDSPAEALASAQQGLHDSDGGPAMAAAAGFICIGSGLSPLGLSRRAPARTATPVSSGV